MTTERLLAEMRTLLGNPSVNEVPDRELTSFLVSSLVWLAGEVRLDYVTDNQVAMTANQAEYVLPKGLGFVVWVELNSTLLTPTSTWAMNLNNGDWRSVPAGTPTQYAVEGRTLILNPAPSAALIATTPYFAWRYIGTGDDISASSTPELSDLDQLLVRYDAAIGWLAAHPTPDNQARITEYNKEVIRRLPTAKQRWENSLLGYYPTLQPETRGRLYPAR